MNKTTQELEIGERSKVALVPLERLETNPWNCNVMSEAQMSSLLASMVKNGRDNVQPLIARPLESGKLQIIDGEHRYLAAKHLRWTSLPVLISEIDEGRAKVMSIALNYVRGKLDPTKLFETFYNDWEGGAGKLTTRELEEQYGHLFDQSWIVRILQLRKLAPEVREEVNRIFSEDSDSNVSVKHLIVISQLKDGEEQMRFLKALLATNVSVGTLERMVRDYQAGKEAKNEDQHETDERGQSAGGHEVSGEKAKHASSESVLKCTNCGSSYMVNWRRKSVLRLIEEGAYTKAMHVQLT